MPVYSGYRSIWLFSQRFVSHLRAGQVELALDRDAVGFEELGVHLTQQQLLGEVLGADADGAGLWRRTGH